MFICPSCFSSSVCLHSLPFVPFLRFPSNHYHLVICEQYGRYGRGERLLSLDFHFTTYPYQPSLLHANLIYCCASTHTSHLSQPLTFAPCNHCETSMKNALVYLCFE
uniref:Secreted protein n=1 Tax=Ascaris lumbricoides TaxID=6252 RepID=A0A0M3HZ43_ASCLU